MSEILKQSRAEAKELFSLGLITEEQYQEMLLLTARDLKIPAPKKYNGKKFTGSVRNYIALKKFLPILLALRQIL